MKIWTPLVILTLWSFAATTETNSNENVDRIIRTPAGNKVYVNLIAATTHRRWKEILDTIHGQNLIPRENLLALEMYASLSWNQVARENFVDRITQTHDLGLIQIALCFLLGSEPSRCKQNPKQLLTNQMTQPQLNKANLRLATDLISLGIDLLETSEHQDKYSVTDFLAETNRIINAASLNLVSQETDSDSAAQSGRERNASDRSLPPEEDGEIDCGNVNQGGCPTVADIWKTILPNLKAEDHPAALAIVEQNTGLDDPEFLPLRLDLLFKTGKGTRAHELIHDLAKRSWQDSQKLTALMKTLALLFGDQEAIQIPHAEANYRLNQPENISEHYLVHALSTAHILALELAKEPIQRPEAGRTLYSLGKYYLQRHFDGSKDQLKIAKQVLRKAEELLTGDPLRSKVQALLGDSVFNQCDQILGSSPK